MVTAEILSEGGGTSWSLAKFGNVSKIFLYYYLANIPG